MKIKINKKVIDKSDFVINTYPRTGSSYLWQLIIQNSDFIINKSHDIDIKSNFIITIIRDPYETIKSSVAMDMHYKQKTSIINSIYHYNEFFMKKINDANFIINYNSLINKPFEVLKKIEEKTDLKFYDVLKYKNILSDNEKNGYLVTSKKTKSYNLIKIDKDDLIDSYKIYDSVILKTDI